MTDAANAAADRDDGSASVEYVVWLTLFLGLFSVIADLSFVYSTNADMWHVANDAARRMAMDEMTAEEAETYAMSALAPRVAEAATVTASASDDVQVRITVPMGDATLFGFYAAVDDGTLGASVTMRREPMILPDFADDVLMAGGS